VQGEGVGDGAFQEASKEHGITALMAWGHGWYAMGSEARINPSMGGGHSAHALVYRIIHMR
jgi:hypothetical protein